LHSSAPGRYRRRVSAEIRVEGLADLEAKLICLGEVAGLKVLRSAARKSFAPVLEEAKRLVPVSDAEGPHLRDALALTTKAAGYIGQNVVATVGIQVKRLPSKVRRMLRKLRKEHGVTLSIATPRRYWHLVEFGASRTHAHPFIRRAIDAKKLEALNVLQSELRKKVERAMKKQHPGES